MFATDVGITLGAYQVSAVSLYNNIDVILNSIAYINDKEDTITIRKNYDQVTYTLTEEQSDIVVTIIFGLPILIVLLGIIVWIVRLKKTNGKIKIKKIKVKKDDFIQEDDNEKDINEDIDKD